MVKIESPTRTATSEDSQITVRTGRDMESYPVYGDVFHGEVPLEGLDVQTEPIAWSVATHHRSYNPAVDPDPLVEYGGVDGLLPGYTRAESDDFRDILIRWSAPHVASVWSSVPEAVDDFCKDQFAVGDVLQHEYEGNSYYSLMVPNLNAIGSLLITINQILGGLNEFLHNDSSVQFTMDPNYALFRIMCWNECPKEIVLTVPLLQKRVNTAVKHVKRLFNQVRQVILTFDETQSVSSFNSTEPDKRAALLTRSLMSVVARLALRDDVGWERTEEEQQALNGLVERRKVLHCPPMKTAPYICCPPTLRVDAPAYV